MCVYESRRGHIKGLSAKLTSRFLNVLISSEQLFAKNVNI